jgi:hypothetical protein
MSMRLGQDSAAYLLLIRTSKYRRFAPISDSWSKLALPNDTEVEVDVGEIPL